MSSEVTRRIQRRAVTVTDVDEDAPTTVVSLPNPAGRPNSAAVRDTLRRLGLTFEVLRSGPSGARPFSWRLRSWPPERPDECGVEVVCATLAEREAAVNVMADAGWDQIAIRPRPGGAWRVRCNRGVELMGHSPPADEGRCKFCGEVIVWATAADGASVPLEAVPQRGGRYARVRRAGEWRCEPAPRGASGRFYVRHECGSGHDAA